METFLLVAVVTGLLLGATGFVLVVRQQGRILVALDALLEAASVPEYAGSQHVVGDRLEPFSLPRLDAAGAVSLEDLRGTGAMLVHWSPDCGYCATIAPDLGRLAPRLRDAGTELVLLARGSADANLRLAREHALDCRQLRLDDATAATLFGSAGTPAALLVDVEGAVSNGLVVGADDVLALAASVAGDAERPAATNGKEFLLPLSQSRIERNGLARGAPAPQFELEDLDGGSMSLAEHLGKRVILVFTDTGCGPCDAILGGIADLRSHPAYGSLTLLGVARGDAAANRAKVARFGLDFPIGLQDHWKLSRSFGIFETPVAFLVDEDGKIARKVARGPGEILELLHDELRVAKEVTT